MKADLPDIEVSRNIRRVLVRHRIDLGWLSIITARGRVHIHGKLLPLGGTGQELTAVSVGIIFDEARRAAGVQRITTELSNWLQDGLSGAWKKRGPSGHVTVTPESQAQKPEVFDVT